MDATALDEQDFADIRECLKGAADLYLVESATLAREGETGLAAKFQNDAARCKALAEKIAREVGV